MMLCLAVALFLIASSFFIVTNTFHLICAVEEMLVLVI